MSESESNELNRVYIDPQNGRIFQVCVFRLLQPQISVFILLSESLGALLSRVSAYCTLHVKFDLDQRDYTISMEIF